MALSTSRSFPLSSSTNQVNLIAKESPHNASAEAVSCTHFRRVVLLELGSHTEFANYSVLQVMSQRETTDSNLFLMSVFFEAVCTGDWVVLRGELY